MAEGGVPSEDPVIKQDEDNELTCTVCMETYKEPKVLPCCHTFCMKCLERMLELNREKSKPVSLPVEIMPSFEKDIPYEPSDEPQQLDNIPCEPSDEPQQLDNIPCGSSSLDSEPQPLKGVPLAEPVEPPSFDELLDTVSVPKMVPMNIAGPSFVSFAPIDDDDDETKFASPIFPEPNEHLTCPLCKEKHVLPKGGIEDLPFDHSILDRLEQESVKQSLTQKKSDCVLCGSDEDAQEYCIECGGVLCDFCVKAHKRQKTYNDHNVVALNQVDPAADQYVSPKKIKVCRKHKKEIVYYCNDCKQFICHVCVRSSGHQQHDFITIEEADESCLSKAKELVNASQQKLAKFYQHKNYIQRIEKDIVTSTHTDELKRMINCQFDEYAQALQRRRDQLLGNAEEASNSSKKGLWAQKEFVDRIITTLESGVKFAQRVRQCTDQFDRIEMNSQGISRLRAVSHASWEQDEIKPPLIFKPSRHQPALKSIASWGKLSAITEEEIHLEIEEGGKPTVCNPVLLTIKFDVHPLSQPHLQVLYGKSQQVLDTSQVAVYESEEPSSYNIEFVPRVSGEHIVEVCLAGVTVARKAFDVTGKPRYRNNVLCGPDWAGGPMVDKVHVGTVNLIQSKLVTVDWGDGIESEHKWGEDGVYEIEIVPEHV